jgi:predicted transcriptional regulator
MPTRKQTISVRLDDATKRRVERAARLLKQSSGAFLEKVGEEQARKVLVAWAVDRHRRGEASFSELAAETGLAIEEVMLASGNENSLDTLESFLASCRSMAESSGDPDFLRASEEAVRTVKRGLSRPFAITPDS